MRDERITIVDVRAKNQSYKTYIVAIQVADVDRFNKNVLLNVSKNHYAHFESGDDFEKTSTVFFIEILDFVATKK